MWDIHHRVQLGVCLCMYNRKTDRGWMKKRGCRTNRKQKSDFIPFRYCQLPPWRARGGINLRAEEAWSMAFLDKLNPPQARVWDIFPSENYVGKCEYLSKRGAESWKQQALVGKVGWNMLDKLDFVSPCLRKSSSDGLIEADTALHLRLPLWLGPLFVFFLML